MNKANDEKNKQAQAGESVEESIADGLRNIVENAHFVTDREQMQNYLADETAVPVRPKPANDLVLVRPANTQQVSAVLQLANKHGIAVFPRGGGTGLVGGAIPTRDGVILSLERLNRIEIDKENMMAIAEAGVTLDRLTKTANEFGLFFPPHPGDENAQMGGLVATNAGGSRAVRYGVMRNQVKALEIVTPTGAILDLGGKLHKNNVGYDIMQLIIGSEGTLAVVTKVILRLYPKFGATATIILPFTNRNDAMSTVQKILQDAGIPLAIEYVERGLLEMTAKHLGEKWPVKIGEQYLIIIGAEASRDQLLPQSVRIREICQQNGGLEPFYVESQRDQDKILRIRSNIYFALKNETWDILDIAVPVSELVNVVDDIEEIAKRDKLFLPVFGHAADGNLHIHIMKRESDTSDYVDTLRNRIYEIAINAGGVITGEHGIGKIRTNKLQSSLSREEIALMSAIKKLFDPKNVLNPGTKIPV
jgi:glycolate oxidase